MQVGVRSVLFCAGAFFGLVVPAAAAVPVAFDESPDAMHERAVNLARHQKYSESVAILEALLRTDPNNYPARRDYVIIATWMERCDIALKQYEKIASVPDQESYLVGPVAQCLADAGETQRALNLLNDAHRRSGDDESQDALRRIKHRFALERRAVVDAAAATSKSDADSREWFFSARLKRKMSDQMAWYVRFLHVRADDPAFAMGDFHRLGAGLIYGASPEATLIQDFAAEMDDGSSLGSTTTLVLTPSTLLQAQIEFATYAEDVSLRARAEGIEATRFTGSINYHTTDYRWDASGGFAFYDFTDNNRRSAANASLGYAFELAPRREQRVIGSVAHSNNTLDNTVYYNPDSDLTLTLTYKLDLVYESAFPRHVDHLYAHIGSYAQQNEVPHSIYGIRYEQDYDFDELTAFTWGVALRSNVYDGNREFEANVNVSVSRKI